MNSENNVNEQEAERLRELMKMGKFSEAEKFAEEILKRKPADFHIWFLLGTINGLTNQTHKAELAFREAISLAPQYPQIYCNLGSALGLQKKYDEAKSSFLEALRLNPLYPQAYYNLGKLHQDLYELDEASKCYRKAIEVRPNYTDAYYNLGTLYYEQGLVDKAVDKYRNALAIEPAHRKSFNNLVFCLNYQFSCDRSDLFREHLRFGELFGGQGKDVVFGNVREVGRRLKVGYVSGDFRDHSVAHFVEALLREHKREEVEVTCYMSGGKEDAMTQHLRSLCDHWVSIAGLNDDQAAERIRSDGMDVLVDLSGHTLDNRLGIFARRAAPVQVTYLGYPNTTGLKEMDYRLTDGWADPEELEPERYYTEKLVRLKGGFLSYTPPAGGPEVGSLPALEEGYVTFGSFNNLAKVNEEVVRVWSAILKEVSGSRLLLKNQTLSDAGVRERYRGLFEAQGVDRDRVELLGYVEEKGQHLEIYNRVDIGLDPFPYNGTTTTCEALWMGVPVVVLAGDRHAGRVGVSLLSQAGLKEWITTSEEDYIQRAVELAGDLESLARLRSGLRERMRTSSLCDGKLLASQVEQAYRDMWKKWCDRR